MVDYSIPSLSEGSKVLGSAFDSAAPYLFVTAIIFIGVYLGMKYGWIK